MITEEITLHLMINQQQKHVLPAGISVNKTPSAVLTVNVRVNAGINEVIKDVIPIQKITA